MESASGRHSGESGNPALTTPLSCAGTPEELDTEAGGATRLAEKGAIFIVHADGEVISCR